MNYLEGMYSNCKLFQEVVVFARRVLTSGNEPMICAIRAGAKCCRACLHFSTMTYFFIVFIFAQEFALRISGLALDKVLFYCVLWLVEWDYRARFSSLFSHLR